MYGKLYKIWTTCNTLLTYYRHVEAGKVAIFCRVAVGCCVAVFVTEGVKVCYDESWTGVGFHMAESISPGRGWNEPQQSEHACHDKVLQQQH